MTTLLDELGRWSAQVDREGIPTRTRVVIERSLTDTVGLILAGSAETFMDRIAPLAIAWGSGEESTTATLPRRLPVTSAAFVNGCAAHGLDFDDTHLPSVLHPSAVVVPAALAVAEHLRRSGRDLLEAVAVGDELAIRLGMAGYDRVRRDSIFLDRGQHATSICGAAGAAAAAARLLMPGDAGAFVNAVGIAASFGSGILEQNRTGGTVKRVHAGWAAHAGVTAAVLAREGVTAAPTTFEGRFGFVRAWCGEGGDHGAITARLGARWEADDLHLKPYPCNHFTHTTADAAFAFRDRHGLRPADVAAVTLGLPEPVLRAVAEPAEAKARPRSGYAAAFSAPYVFAAAMCTATRSGLGLSVDDFTDAAASRSEVVDLAARVVCEPDPVCTAIFPRAFPVTATVVTTAGRRIMERVHVQRGGASNPLSDREVMAKFRFNASRARSRGDTVAVGRAAAIVGALSRVDSVTEPVRILLGVSSPEPAGRRSP